MALTGEAIKKWAVGATAPKNGAPVDADPSGDFHEETPGEDIEGEESTRNPIWAGEYAGGDVDEEEAEELIDWLEENEPEIHAAIVHLASAIADPEADPTSIDQAKEELDQATQYLNPEYEPLTPDQRSQAGDLIAVHMQQKGNPPGGSPEWKQAVAIGLAQARAGKSADDGTEDGSEGGQGIEGSEGYDDAGGEG